MAKNLYIAATGKDVGKSTISFAIINHFISSGAKVGFMKPVGQRWLPCNWGEVEEDVILMKEAFNFLETPSDMNPIVIKKGFTEEYLTKSVKPDLSKLILEAYNRIAKDKDYIIIEGTGHAGVGSVINQSNADVAKLLDSKVILVAKGGIGSAIDSLELNREFFESKGCQVIGVIVNKVLQEKLEKVKNNIKRYCRAHKLTLLGIIPYSPVLSNPTLGQIIDEMKPEIINETSERDIVIERIFVGAYPLKEFIEFVHKQKGALLGIFPTSRLDLLMSIPTLNKNLKDKNRIFAILFSGNIPPSEYAMVSLKDENINILWKKGDTYSIISQLSSISIKTRSKDKFKIEEIKKIVIGNIEIKRIIKLLTNAKIIAQRNWKQKITKILRKGKSALKL
ncbi:MAG: AAA family ATPase [Candidatus Cloacimonadota bacterium]|nr:AAA family ATPase [Candidatus Cloacimonadota bacterium]